MYSEVEFDLYHIKELTPYLDDITYIDPTRKPHPISLKMRGFAWYYVYNGNHKSDAYSRSAYGKLNKKTGKILILNICNLEFY